MVECRNVTVDIGKKIVDDVSFTAKEGEITVIIGKNGSGKTTLLRCISSLVKYAGDIFIDDKNIKSIPRKEKSKIIATMAQNLPKPPFTVEKLVSFGRSPYTGVSGILTDEDKKCVSECIREAEIEYIAKKTVDEISGGERRKAFFAMMLAQNAPVILLDEPTANLDSEYTHNITRMIEKRKNKRDTVIVVLHDVNHTIRIADKIIAMEEGKKVFEGSAEEAIAENLPQKLFGLKKYVSVEGEIFYA